MSPKKEKEKLNSWKFIIANEHSVNTGYMYIFLIFTVNKIIFVSNKFLSLLNHIPTVKTVISCSSLFFF